MFKQKVYFLFKNNINKVYTQMSKNEELIEIGNVITNHEFSKMLLYMYINTKKYNGLFWDKGKYLQATYYILSYYINNIKKLLIAVKSNIIENIE